MTMCLFIWREPSFGFIPLRFQNHILLDSFSAQHFPPGNENLPIVHVEAFQPIQLNKSTPCTDLE